METSVIYQVQAPFIIANPMALGSMRLEHACTIDVLSPHAQSLAYEVSNEKAKQQRLEQAGDTSEPWYYLSGTGFFVHGQIDLFLKDIQQEIQNGRLFQDAIDFCLVKIREDVKGFENEYLKQLAGLKWNIGWKNVDGEQKLYGVDYNGALLEELTGREEREGALYDIWFTDREDEGKVGIESWLRTAPVGSKVLVVSPSGWSGYENFIYPQTQIYYVEVGEGDSLRAFTLRYDVPIDKNEAFQEALGISVTDTRGERARIKQMLANPIFIGSDGTPEAGQSDRKIYSPEDVIDLMQTIKGSAVAFSDPKFGDRTFDSMRTFIRNPEQFSTRHPQAQPLIDAFYEYASWELSQGESPEDTRQNLEIALAVVIVELKELYFPSTPHASDSDNMQTKGIFQDNLNYKQQLSEIRELPGCAGTIEKSGVFINSLGTFQIADFLESQGICEKAICRQCGREPSEDDIAKGACGECGWAPGKPVDKNWNKKKDAEETDKPTEKQTKKKGEPIPPKVVAMKPPEGKTEPELPSRRSVVHTKAA